jgi:hypothetical protein
MPVYLQLYVISLRFSAARYLRFRSQALTASRAVTDRIDMLSHFMGDCAKPASPCQDRTHLVRTVGEVGVASTKM